MEIGIEEEDPEVDLTLEEEEEIQEDLGTPLINIIFLSLLHI